VQDHYWVQATIGGQDTDLNPTFKGAAVNSKLAEAQETFDPDALEGAHRFAQGIDLINAPFQFVGDAADAVRLEADIADTALERLTVTPNSNFNTVPLFEAASAQSVSVLTISPQQTGTLDSLAVPAAIKNVLAGELAQGQTLVLPARLVRLGEVQTYGWWSVDPTSGIALGKMELGGAQAMTETADMHERIEKWTEIFAKFYGGLLHATWGRSVTTWEAWRPSGPVI